jgi:Tfp pilus assembly protein PilF
MFFIRMQSYANLNDSRVLATRLAKFSAPVTPSISIIMPAKIELKKAPLIESLILPKLPITHYASTKSPVNARLQTEANLTNIRLKSLTDEDILNAVDKSMLMASVTDAAPPNVSKNLLKNSPIKLISHMSTTAVDDSLLEAYQALNHREYIVAQQQYQQVLQGDMRNIDALLGMAVIAQQQGRDADAQAWDEKVLEVEPRNAIALSLMSSYQANNDIIAEESKLKSMLAQQPEAASFHAALGNLYANQNQWQTSQEAFFNACRFAPNNADYAFNLAISLEHMAKYSLALEQYQRALKLLNLSGVASPDRAQLEVRVKALLSFNIEK